MSEPPRNDSAVFPRTRGRQRIAGLTDIAARVKLFRESESPSVHLAQAGRISRRANRCKAIGISNRHPPDRWTTTPPGAGASATTQRSLRTRWQRVRKFGSVASRWTRQPLREVRPPCRGMSSHTRIDTSSICPFPVSAPAQADQGCRNLPGTTLEAAVSEREPRWSIGRLSGNGAVVFSKKHLASGRCGVRHANGGPCCVHRAIPQEHDRPRSYVEHDRQGVLRLDRPNHRS